MSRICLLIAVLTAVVAVVPSASTAAPADSGVVYRYYAGTGYRFNPLLSFANLNRAVTLHDRAGARRLAAALVPRGKWSRGVLLWEYDFRFGAGPARWTSGFTQVVAAQALARASRLLDDPQLMRAAHASFRALAHGLVLSVDGGSWIREYGFTRQVILNAQLQSILSLESYAQAARSPAAATLAGMLEVTTARLLPQFDLGCWARYELGGVAADAHYEAYHVELLRRLAATHSAPVWRDMYRKWRRCV
jgi:hypothetical protein